MAVSELDSKAPEHGFAIFNEQCGFGPEISVNGNGGRENMWFSIRAMVGSVTVLIEAKGSQSHQAFVYKVYLFP